MAAVPLGDLHHTARFPVWSSIVVQRPVTDVFRAGAAFRKARGSSKVIMVMEFVDGDRIREAQKLRPTPTTKRKPK